MPGKTFPKRDVTIDAGRFLLRTLTREDASDRWAAWMSEPKNLRLLNAAPKAMTRRDIADYIGQFDQRAHILLGIVDKESGDVIGFFRVDLDPNINRCLGFMMIGERRFRHWTTAAAVRQPFHDFLFDTLKLDTALGTVLASNRAMLRYMLRSGWVLDKTAERNVKAHGSNEMLDLCYVRLTREAWRAWKEKHGAQK